jgi:hypothetical protein
MKVSILWAVAAIFAMIVSVNVVAQEPVMPGVPHCVDDHGAWSPCGPVFYDEPGIEVGPARESRLIMYWLELESDGEIDEAEVARSLERDLPRLRRCFDPFHDSQTRREPIGAIRLRIIVRDMGNLSRTEILHSPPGQRLVANCLLNRGRQLPLRGIEEGVGIRVTLHSREVLSEPFREVASFFGPIRPDLGRREEEFDLLEVEAELEVEVAEGRVFREAVELITRSHLPEIEQCYRMAILHDRTFSGEGKVRLELTSGESGWLTDAVVTLSEPGSDQLDGCIERMASHWSFPAPSEDGEKIIVLYELKVTEWTLSE